MLLMLVLVLWCVGDDAEHLVVVRVLLGLVGDIWTNLCH
jgi:hypothetical protein